MACNIFGFAAVLSSVLQLAILQPSISQGNIEGASLSELLRDPYIVIAAGAITFANLGIAVLEPSLPLWLMDTMHTPKWQQGVITALQFFLSWSINIQVPLR